MAVTRGQKSTFASGSTVAVTTTWGTNPTVGSTVLVWVQAIGNVQFASVVDNGLTQSTFVQDVGNNTTNGAYVFRAHNVTMPAAGAYTVTVTTVLTGFKEVIGFAYTGLLKESQPEAFNTGQGTGTAVSTGAVVGSTGDLYFAGFSDASALVSESITLTGSFTQQYVDVNGNARIAQAVADFIGSGSQTCTWTLGDSVAWSAAIVCYRAATVSTAAPALYQVASVAPARTPPGLSAYTDVDQYLTNDPYVVHQAGIETITGPKSFAAPVYPAEPGLVSQGAVPIYAVTGQPDNAFGVNGAFCFSASGGIWQKRFGTWQVVAATSAPVPNKVPPLGYLAVSSGYDASSVMTNTQRYNYLIIQNYEYADIPAIRNTDPSTKILCYKNIAESSNPDGQPAATSQCGVPYAYANANHPEWFLLKAGSVRITFSDFPTYYAMDVGNLAYQNQWAQNVIQSAITYGFDGIFLDDVTTVPGHGMSGTFVTPPYSDLQYGQAQLSFIQNVCPQIRGAGLLAVPNLSSSLFRSAELGLAQAMMPYCSSIFREFFVNFSGTPTTLFNDKNWTDTTTLMATAQNLGVGFFPNAYGLISETNVMRYLAATFYMIWDGNPRSAFCFSPTTATDPYSQADWGRNIGVPLAPKFAVGVGWQRNYTLGCAIVNPSSTTAQTFALGATYHDPTGASVSSVNLPLTTGMLLYT